MTALTQQWTILNSEQESTELIFSLTVTQINFIHRGPRSTKA